MTTRRQFLKLAAVALILSTSGLGATAASAYQIMSLIGSDVPTPVPTPVGREPDDYVFPIFTTPGDAEPTQEPTETPASTETPAPPVLENKIYLPLVEK